jgi:PAS domain S-box-containing protein
VELPFASVHVVEGRVVDGTAWLVALVRDCTADTDRPWLDPHPWRGTVSIAGRRFAVAGVGTAVSMLWQFVELPATESLLQAAIAQLPDALSITTAELAEPGPAFVYANPAFETLTGWRLDEVLGKTPRILQGPRTDRSELERLVEVLTSGESFRGGALNYRQNGEAFWNEWAITAIRDQDGMTTHYVTTMRDATGERIASHQLRAAASEWASVIDALDASIVMTYPDGRIARCNRAFASWLDLPFATLVGASLAEVVFQAERIPDALYHPRVSTIDLPHCGGWYAVDGRPVSRDSQIVAWVHTFTNVTRSEHTTRQLRRLALAADSMQDGVLLTDATGSVEYGNPAISAILGCEREALIGTHVRDWSVLPADILEETPKTLRHRHRRPDDRTTTLELSVGHINEDGRLLGFYVVVRDLTERDRLLGIAEQASTLGNVSQWLGGLRHELGNPVNSVKMALTVLRSHLSTLSTADIERYVDRAASELSRIEFLLRSLKTFSLYDVVELETIACRPALSRLVSLLEPDLATQDVSLALDIEGELALLGDPRALHQALINLVTNAVDATVASPRSTHSTVWISARRDGANIVISIRDEGVGIASERLSRMFQPFETTKPAGTGLGLVLVHRLVTSMRGRVELESELGHGTTVRLYFGAA